jgi:hypothetical protein
MSQTCDPQSFLFGRWSPWTRQSRASVETKLSVGPMTSFPAVRGSGQVRLELRDGLALDLPGTSGPPSYPPALAVLRPCARRSTWASTAKARAAVAVSLISSASESSWEGLSVALGPRPQVDHLPAFRQQPADRRCAPLIHRTHRPSGPPANMVLGNQLTDLITR